MPPRVAIHGQGGRFTQGWIDCCRERGIDHEVISGYATDIIDRLRGFDAFCWHFLHREAADLLMARHVLYSAAEMGVAVFPDFRTSWHFDDKIAQKYLLEAIGAPLVPTYAFFDEESAVQWLRTAKYPLVRKLRRGAGSYNVGLLRDFAQARRYCRRAFGKGFAPLPGHLTDLSTRVRRARTSKTLLAMLARSPKSFAKLREAHKRMQPEKGYVLFQEFISGNTFDTRVTVVGPRAWAFTRDVRKNDFRASGSGSVNYDRQRVSPRMVPTAFEIAEALGSQSTCFDFLVDQDGSPLLTEISYGYLPEVVNACAGYWDRQMNWLEPNIRVEEAILDDVLARAARRGGQAE